MGSVNPRSKQQDIFNAMGSMYAAVIFLGVKNSSVVQPVVAVERTVFYRERAAGMYSALPYAVAQVTNHTFTNSIKKKHIAYSNEMDVSLSLYMQVLIEVPYVFVQAMVYGIIVYVMVGFEWTVAKFFWYIFFMYVTFLYFTYYGMMSVALTPNQHFSAICAFAFYPVWNLFSGFVIPRTVSFLSTRLHDFGICKDGLMMQVFSSFFVIF